MFESLISIISTAPPLLVYCILLAIPFVENIFPPSPSDIIIVIGGSLIAKGTIAFVPALLLTALGSELGFLFLYYLGSQTDRKLVHSGRFKFLSIEAVDVAERWFQRYGYFIILFNRFISGIRSVISFFAGMSQLSFNRTLVLSSVSSVLWHLLLLLLGYFFGSNVKVVDHYLNLYAGIITALVCVAAAAATIRYFYKRRAKRGA